MGADVQDKIAFDVGKNTNLLKYKLHFFQLLFNQFNHSQIINE